MDQLSDIINPAVNLVKGIHQGMPIQGKISGLVLLLIAIWKSSILRPYWNKWGEWKMMVAPLLGILMGVAAIQPFSWSAVGAGLMGGVLAIPLHEFLDALKSAPWLGAQYQNLISFFESLLQMPPAPPAPPAAS